MKIRFIIFRLPRLPDLKSPHGADTCTDGAEDALAFPFFDEVLVYQSPGYCTN
ncbi:Uncharacterised protein [uncultured archaeon]|nr:Uncharacterised protein [uncultured archaeon]